MLFVAYQLALSAQQKALIDAAEENFALYLPPPEIADIIVYMASVPVELQWDPKEKQTRYCPHV